MSIKISSFDDGFINHLVDQKNNSAHTIKSEAAVTERVVHMAASGAGVSKFDLERYFGTNDLLRFNYLQRGIIAGLPVVRIRVSAEFGAGGNWGTGFLITPRLLITNNHVISSKAEANRATVEFGYQTDVHDYLRSGKIFRLDPDKAFITSEEKKLDYTIIAIQETSIDASDASTAYGFIRLNGNVHKVDTLEYVSIIQHPNGDEKCVAIRENKVIKIGDEMGGEKDNLIWYECDTALGSSGAPVFNDQWQVVALHHKAVARTVVENGINKVVLKDGSLLDESLADYNDDRIDFIANEGIRISRIVADIKEQYVQHNFSLIKELLDDIDGISAIPGTILKESIIAGSEPLTGSQTLAGTFSLTEAATKKKIRAIEYYDGRTGYAENFLNNVLPLPVVGPKALDSGNIAEVRNTGDNVLRYTHYSLVFNERRKLPFFTAVNIDGKKWKNLDRGNDVWYYDPRIAIELQIGNDFYSDEPKEYKNKGWFDRGHLVRRLDPVWGRKEVAVLANEDTFHWTNCSPQYWGFNQGSELWQGLENYILYNADEENVKATVFTGPIFREDDELHRNVQVPKFFWKLVAVESQQGQLFTSAYIADQSEWATDIPFEELPVGKYQDYQVSIAKLASATGLQFDATIINADVLKGSSDRGLRGLTEIIHPRR